MNDHAEHSTEKRTWDGIGPRLALLTIPYVVLAIVLAHKDPGFLAVTFLNPSYASPAGYCLIIIGLVFWGASAVVFLTDFKHGGLITRGPFALCRNPIYASIIVFLLPGLTLMFQSGVVLSIDLVLYLNFKLAIHGEVILLRREFGTAYDAYENNVHELFPFPKLTK